MSDPAPPPFLPESLTCNAWTGQAAASGSISPDWRKWTIRPHATHAPGVIPSLLAVQDPASLENWRHPDVGWGLVMADCPGRPVAERAVAADAPAPIRELLKSRPGSPVFRYKPEYNNLYLQLDTPDGVTCPISIAGSARGIGRSKLPRYLLIFGSPRQIPWSLQFVLEAAAFTGRLDLEGTALENYVSHLIDGWPNSLCRRDSPVIWSTDHGPDDITWLMREAIAKPLAKDLAADAETSPRLAYRVGNNATHDELLKALAANHPAWIVTTSHGNTGPLNDLQALARKLGLLVDAAYQLLDPEVLLKAWQPDGAIWYSHACCSAGSETGTNYAGLLAPGSSADLALAGIGQLGGCVAPLPTALLGASKPLRAFIGHVEPTFNWTLRDPQTHQVLTSPLRQALYSRLYLKNPPPVPVALRDYHAEIGTLISQWAQLLLDRASPNPALNQDAIERAFRTKLNAVDHQSCVFLGDPTVALPPLVAA